MAVKTIREVEHPEEEVKRLRLVRPEEGYPVPPPPAPPPTAPSFPTKEVVAILSAIAAIVSARVILMFAFVGGAFLFYLAVIHPSVGSITAASMFAALVFWPLAYLALRKG